MAYKYHSHKIQIQNTKYRETIMGCVIKTVEHQVPTPLRIFALYLGNWCFHFNLSYPLKYICRVNTCFARFGSALSPEWLETGWKNLLNAPTCLQGSKAPAIQIQWPNHCQCWRLLTRGGDDCWQGDNRVKRCFKLAFAWNPGCLIEICIHKTTKAFSHSFTNSRSITCG